MKPTILFLSSLLLLAACQQEARQPETLVRPVLALTDPFIGTGGHGHTFPGATLPFGMVQLSPDNGTEGWDWCSGYHYSDSLIAGFSHLHLSGTGIGDLTDVSIMPYFPSEAAAGPRIRFGHDQEKAEPGYYSVRLSNGILAELTATRRVGLHQYTFPADSGRVLALNLGFRINWDKPTETQFTHVSDTLVTGMRKSTGWAKNQWVYFAAQFSAPLQSVELFEEGRPLPGREATGRAVRALMHFAPGAGPLGVKVGISGVSVEGALANLRQEAGNLSFQQAREQAASAWEKELSKISASLITPQWDTVFYTALYHTAMAPSLFSDVDGAYKGGDHTPRKAEGYERYTVFSLWDTFRAAHPLYTITQHERLNDFFRSMTGFHQETGLLPVWELAGNETNTMTGYHAVPVLADAILKGYLTENVEQVYQAMLASASQNIRGTDLYRQYGYIPADLFGWSVTKTLEYAFDDWAIAQVARKLGHQADYERFSERARSYKPLFDAQTGFMRAKNSKGQWVEPFDPFYSEHGFEGMYVEGTAWQHTWFVPHDVAGLISLYGSKEAFARHLDSTFNVTSEMRGENVSADISGLIGQYAHGNEPSHHVAYLFNYAGMPWKTQERVRQIMLKMYHTGPDGLSGNEDCGQMSAWAVFSALGFYPVNPADGCYVIGSPMVSQAEIPLPGGKSFRIIARENALDRPYVQSVKLNGQPLTRTYFTHQELMQGGTLEFVMGATPNYQWGTEPGQAPPSMSDR